MSWKITTDANELFQNVSSRSIHSCNGQKDEKPKALSPKEKARRTFKKTWKQFAGVVAEYNVPGLTAMMEERLGPAANEMLLQTKPRPTGSDGESEASSSDEDSDDNIDIDEEAEDALPENLKTASPAIKSAYLEYGPHHYTPKKTDLKDDDIDDEAPKVVDNNEKTEDINEKELIDESLEAIFDSYDRYDDGVKDDADRLVFRLSDDDEARLFEDHVSGGEIERPDQLSVQSLIELNKEPLHRVLRSWTCDVRTKNMNNVTVEYFVMTKLRRLDMSSQEDERPKDNDEMQPEAKRRRVNEGKGNESNRDETVAIATENGSEHDEEPKQTNDQNGSGDDDAANADATSADSDIEMKEDDDEEEKEAEKQNSKENESDDTGSESGSNDAKETKTTESESEGDDDENNIENDEEPLQGRNDESTETALTETGPRTRTTVRIVAQPAGRTSPRRTGRR